MIRSSDVKRRRCAIYTRVSTPGQANGDFSSIDNQREAAEAYVTSQAGGGWVALDTRYDDAGFSGANTQRPGLQRLLRHIDAGKVDCIVVYKIDRLSRSLLDFAQLVEVLDRRGVDFVSVTQQFDTSASMGKLTLNILLSFAQFEREMIAERTRDKIMAARAKGKWTGGILPLGYDLEEGKLVPNEGEAERVRSIFGLYGEHESLAEVVVELAKLRWISKSWTTTKGHRHPGKPFTVATLRKLLTNPVYAGLMRCGKTTTQGEHEAIVERDTWEAVQARLAGNGAAGGRTTKNKHGMLLRGILRCANCDAAMTPSFSRKGSRHYRYYRCVGASKNGTYTCPTRSLPAQKVEGLVVEQIRRIGRDPGLVKATLVEAEKQRKEQLKFAKVEVRTIERDLTKLRRHEERAFNTVQRGGRAATLAGTRLEELADSINEASQRLDTAQAHRDALENLRIDPADLRRAVESFDPIWDVLLPHERARVVRLLVEQVDYDGETDELGIAFRADGVRELAEEREAVA